ncbi:diacylglycerol/lipid kinase family protein [Pseudonocardia sp.]|uniref:diacylglycerol/lipid kinase family protein n=1 Tax=Pseudonocardia sp. TaxID=60912 RepID=UPI003D09FE51
MLPLLVLANDAAGGVDDAVRHAVLDTLREGAEVVTASPDGPGELDAVLAAYPQHRPVAVGGDGTLHLLVAALHARGELDRRVLGLVPQGTGNDFAGTLGVPDEPVAAARAVLHGRERALDLLVDDTGAVVVNAVHLGIGARANREGTPLKPVLGPLAYPVGAVLAGLRSSGWPLRVLVDGRTLADGVVLQVGIGNGRTVGGGTPITPDAAPDDGAADVVVSTATGLLARLHYGRLLRAGRHGEHPEVVTARGAEIEVSGGPVPVNADGEPGEPVTRRRWTLRPAAWRITVPR